MTAKETPDTDPDIIEGVAVEQPASSAGRRRSAGHSKSRSGTGRAKQPSATAAPDKTKHDDGAPDKSMDGASAGTAKVQRNSLPIMFGATAILLALAGIVIQQWMMARQESQLRTEIETLAAQIDAANDSLVRAQTDIAAIGAGQTESMARLAGLEAELPQDPAEALSALSARLDMLAADMEALPDAGDAAQPPFDTGLALAQAGLGAANAMNAANLAGADPVQWVPVLKELARAGLDVGDLAGIEALLTPPPASTAQLLAKGGDLAALMAQDRDGAAGWWQNNTGWIAGFIRLRRSENAPSAAQSQPEDALPLDEFARALRTGNLVSSLAVSRQIVPPPASLAEWQAGAQGRLDLDAALAGLMAAMTARLAAAGVAD